MKLISHLVAREAKLPEKPGLKMNTGGGDLSTQVICSQ